jgi:hypothetical protein
LHVAQTLHFADPTGNLCLVVRGDVLLAMLVVAQVREGGLPSPQVVVAGPQVTHEHQHLGMGHAQSGEDLGRVIVAPFLVEPKGLFGIGLVVPV